MDQYLITVFMGKEAGRKVRPETAELFETEGHGGRSEVQTLERRDGGKERHTASPLCSWEEVGEWMRGLGPQQ